MLKKHFVSKEKNLIAGVLDYRKAKQLEGRSINLKFAATDDTATIRKELNLIF